MILKAERRKTKAPETAKMKQFFKVQVLLIIVLAAPMVLGQESTETTCQNVNTHLTALTAAFNDLCNANTTSTATTPSQTVCICSVEWESTGIIHIGSINMQSTNTQSFVIPEAVPSTAREVLVYVHVKKGGSEDTFCNMKIYTESSPTRRFEKYLPIQTFSQEAVSTVSENMFFPMTNNRQIYVHLTRSHRSWLAGQIHIIGYR